MVPIGWFLTEGNEGVAPALNFHSKAAKVLIVGKSN
jgi:hypothetical protein